MKHSWLDSWASSAFGLHKSPLSNCRKLFVEAQARRGLRLAPLPCVAGGAKCLPGTALPGQHIVSVTRLSPGRPGWHGMISILGPGILQRCWPLQGNCDWYVQHVPCSWERFQAGWALLAKAIPGNRLLSAALFQVLLFWGVLSPTSLLSQRSVGLRSYGEDEK